MDCTGRFESKERTMYSINRIKTAASTLTVGVLLVFALAATAQAGGGGPQRLTAQRFENVRARADAMDRYYHLGRYAVIKTPSPFPSAHSGIGAGASLWSIMLAS